MEKVIIRKAIIEDAVSIAELSNQLGYSTNGREILSRLEKLLTQKGHYVIVAIQDETVCGWVHAFYTERIESAPFVEVGGLVIHDDYRNRGIGKSLITEIFSWTKTMDVKKTRVRCNTIREQAHEFYRSIGFKLKKEQKVFDFEA